MQNKLYKRSTAILGSVVVIDIVAAIWMLVKRDYWIDKFGYGGIILFVVFTLLSTMVYSYYDLNADKNIVKKMVRGGNLAMAKITNGTYYRIVKNARLKKQVLWKLELELYDQEMNIIKTSTIEKCAPFVTQIPKGHVFVTYDPKKPEQILLVPNVIVGSIPAYAELVQEYEKTFKPKYLNVYYNNGLVIKTYEQSLKEKREMEKFKEEVQ